MKKMGLLAVSWEGAVWRPLGKPKHMIFPHPGVPEGFLQFSLKSSVSVPQAVGSPVVPERFPRRGNLPQNGELIAQI